MAVLTNTITTTEMNVALDRELIFNFQQEFDRLNEILGNFEVETIGAGTALYQLKISGSLNDTKTDASDLSGASGAVTLGASSGTAYVEGDEVALSKYSAEKVTVGSVDVVPYRRLTTAAAILKSGYDVAVLRTDRKMLSNVRNSIVSKFFTFLGNGIGTATGTTLQAALAAADAKLGDTLETNGDETDRIIHFVNRQDAAEYLGKAAITTQNAFGLTYIENFLGIQNVFLTNKVAKGSFYITPNENIHVFGLDFSSLASAGLSYTTQSDGLVGVAHTPAYDRVSAETHVVNGTLFFPEVKDYIVKGTVAPEE